MHLQMKSLSVYFPLHPPPLLQSVLLILHCLKMSGQLLICCIVRCELNLIDLTALRLHPRNLLMTVSLEIVRSNHLDYLWLGRLWLSSYTSNLPVNKFVLKKTASTCLYKWVRQLLALHIRSLTLITSYYGVRESVTYDAEQHSVACNNISIAVQGN